MGEAGLTHIQFGPYCTRVTHNLASSIQHAFSDPPDPPSDPNTQHPLINIVTITLCTVIAGTDDLTEIEEFGLTKREWFSTFLDLARDIPSHDTFNRVLARLDPTRWHACFLDWLRYTLSRKLEPGDQIALDGKHLRSSKDDDRDAVHLVNA